MPTDLLFIRHGEARYGSNDGLTDLGVRQAASLARRLHADGIDHVYASTLPRARETAEAVTGLTGHDIRFDARLREIDVGDFASLPEPEIKRQTEHYYRPDGLRDLDFRAQNGEGPVEVHARASESMNDLFLEEARDHGRVAVVSHGGFINAALWFLLGKDFDGLMRFRLANTSITTVRITNQGALILAVNDTTHLLSLDD